MHVPVLFNTVRDVLAPQAGETFVDATIGLGGHAASMLPLLHPGGTLVGVDLDPTRLVATGERLVAQATAVDLRVGVRMVHASYADLADVLAGTRADVLLLDLGFASDQLTAERGFSFQSDGPLQMTYDPDAPSLARRLAKLSERELGELIRTYGEDRWWRRIARSITLRLQQGPITTTRELADAIVAGIPRPARHGGIHPATRTFQALRIWVNDELGSLNRLLDTLPDLMQPGGRVGIISFHSLEDAAVRDRFRQLVRADQARVLTPKALRASAHEIAENPRSRSAQFRALQFLT